MYYQNELDFLRNVLKRCRLQTLIIDPTHNLDARIDFGFSQMLGMDDEYNTTFYSSVPQLREKTVFRYTDSLMRSYIFLILPETKPEKVLLIGPFCKTILSREKILEMAEEYNIKPQDINRFIQYFTNIPVFYLDNLAYSILESFYELIWNGSDNYSIIDVSDNIFEHSAIFNVNQIFQDNKNIEWNMQIMESRYSYENELMQAVSKGHTHKAELLMSSFASLQIEERLADPVRNMKNYSIVMNTLLRKAAENGGVHPIYLDKLSSEFAIKIEQLNTVSAIEKTMVTMFRSYCNLVKKHKGERYSAPVQKAIIRIDSDLSADLSLSTLANSQNISPSYLSNIFKQEVGTTLTDYVTKKRIELAKQLLSSTNLLVQTIAMHCGIMDVQYFSRVFKKYTGKTPKEYKNTK